MTPNPWTVDPGLAERFRAAGAVIGWRDEGAERPAPKAKARPAARDAPRSSVRIAHLNDEEARVEANERPGRCEWVVDSGPVGALVLLLEVHRRGPPSELCARDAAAGSPFPNGAIAAVWEDEAPRGPYELPPADLVTLARYALA